jgi:hypothetical protein
VSFTVIFGRKKAEVTEERKSLYNVKLDDLYSSSNILQVSKSKIMRWAVYVARTEEKRSAFRVLVGKPEGKRPLGRTKRRCGIILRWISRKWEGEA